MSVNTALSTVGNYSVETMKLFVTGVLAHPKVTALAVGVLSTCSLPTASAGPATEIGCMAICTIAAYVNPTAAIYLLQCLKFCEAMGYAPTP